MYTHVHVLLRDDKEERKKERSMVKQTNKQRNTCTCGVHVGIAVYTHTRYVPRGAAHFP